MAISILIMEKENPDLRLVNFTAKLIDFIGSVQKSGFLIRSVRGAVAGSYLLGTINEFTLSKSQQNIIMTH